MERVRRKREISVCRRVSFRSIIWQVCCVTWRLTLARTRPVMQNELGLACNAPIFRLDDSPTISPIEFTRAKHFHEKVQGEEKRKRQKENPTEGKEKGARKLACSFAITERTRPINGSPRGLPHADAMGHTCKRGSSKDSRISPDRRTSCYHGNETENSRKIREQLYQQIYTQCALSIHY